MIKDLRAARLVDAVPRVVAGQDWVRALSEAVGVLHERTLRYIDDSQIYTSLDTATEPVLDALAINWKVDWYDTGYSVDQKRRIIKTALTVRRLMGTVGAVKLQADAIYPGTMLEEWFEYGGQPGTFRLFINVTDTTEEHPAIIYSPAEMERRLITAKRWSAHLESLSYMVRHTLAQTGSKWPFNNTPTTIALAQLRESTKYGVEVTVLEYSGGRLGNIRVTDRARNGFKLVHDGSATTVKVQIRVTGGMTDPAPTE